MIILHIGLHKAGSTTVQTYLRDNALALAEAGVLYPLIGRPERAIAHHRLAADLRAGRPDPAQWTALVRLAEDNPDQRVVISSEGFQSTEPGPIRALIGDHPVKVFCYHRDAAQRFVSAYGHGAKNGFRSIDFDAVFESQFGMKRTYIGETMKAWADAFDGPNVRVRSLHPACLAGGELMADVLEVLGLGPDAEQRLGLRPVGAHNVSPGWKALETLRAVYDDLGPAMATAGADRNIRVRGALLKRALQAETALGLAGRGRYMTEDQMRRMVELEDRDIAEMRAAGLDCRLQPISLDGFEPRQFLPDFDSVPGEEAAALLRHMLSSVVNDYVLRPARADEDEAEAGAGEDEDATATPRRARAAADQAEAQASARPPRAAAGGSGGVDPVKAAKLEAKADRRQGRRAARLAARAQANKAEG